MPLFADWGHAQPAGAIAAQLAEWEAAPFGEVLVAEIGGQLLGWSPSQRSRISRDPGASRGWAGSWWPPSTGAAVWAEP